MTRRNYCLPELFEIGSVIEVTVLEKLVSYSQGRFSPSGIWIGFGPIRGSKHMFLGIIPYSELYGACERERNQFFAQIKIGTQIEAMLFGETPDGEFALSIKRAYKQMFFEYIESGLSVEAAPVINFLREQDDSGRWHRVAAVIELSPFGEHKGILYPQDLFGATDEEKSIRFQRLRAGDKLDVRAPSGIKAVLTPDGVKNIIKLEEIPQNRGDLRFIHSLDTSDRKMSPRRDDIISEATVISKSDQGVVLGWHRQKDGRFALTGFLPVNHFEQATSTERSSTLHALQKYDKLNNLRVLNVSGNGKVTLSQLRDATQALRRGQRTERQH